MTPIFTELGQDTYRVTSCCSVDNAIADAHYFCYQHGGNKALVKSIQDNGGKSWNDSAVFQCLNPNDSRYLHPDYLNAPPVTNAR